MDISSRRTASPFSSALAAFPGRPAVVPGASSYFTAPTEHLDPNLFKGSSGDQEMRPEIARWLLTTVYEALRVKGFRGPEHWLRVWLAGSGASYQWSAARDPGDLDILLGIDYPTFRQSHLEYTGLSDKEISDDINEALQADLWKRTASQRLGGSTYEVTWYVNPGSTDIRDIHPYAAYDVTRQVWSVRPIDLPKAGPGEWFPKEWDEASRLDHARATEIVDRYNRALVDLEQATQDGRWMSANAQLVQASKEAVELFDTIHKGRHAAFEADGEGYRDFANYRWQRGKQLGHVQALRAIKDAVKEARKDAEHRLYGGELKSTEHVLTAAALGRQS